MRRRHMYKIQLVSKCATERARSRVCVRYSRQTGMFRAALEWINHVNMHRIWMCEMSSPLRLLWNSMFCCLEFRTRKQTHCWCCSCAYHVSVCECEYVNASICSAECILRKFSFNWLSLETIQHLTAHRARVCTIQWLNRKLRHSATILKLIFFRIAQCVWMVSGYTFEFDQSIHWMWDDLIECSSSSTIMYAIDTNTIVLWFVCRLRHSTFQFLISSGTRIVFLWRTATTEYISVLNRWFQFDKQSIDGVAKIKMK